MGSPVAPVPNQPIDVVPPSPAVVPEGDATKAWANFAQGLPEDLPETAYNALAERFYDERVAPDVIAKGYATDPIRRKFLSNIQREKVSRTELVAKEAAGALMAPMEALSEQVGGPILPDRSFVGKAQHAEALAHRQGMAVAPYALLGQGIGMAPYFALPMEGAGALGGAVAAGKGLQAVINAGAGALAQGAYDAAKAPTGGRLMAGVQGGLAGAATIGGMEILHNAGPIMKAIKGIAKPAEADAATEQILGDPKLEQKIAAEVGQQEAAAKRAGMPLQTPLGKNDDTVLAAIKAQDGQIYKVSDPIAQAPLISQHLNVGGSIEQVGGDQAQTAKVLRTIENIQGSQGAFDTDAGPSDVTGPSKVKWIKPEEGGPAVPEALPGLDFDKFKEDPINYFNEQAQKVAAMRQEEQPTSTEPSDLEDLLQRSIDQRKAQLDIPKVRGSTPIPLDQQGQVDAMEVGRKSAIKGGFDEIHSGPLPRHVQTADTLEMFNPLAVRPEPNPRISSRQWGSLEGLNQDDISKAMDWYMRESPDAVPPGVSPTSGLPGESTNQLVARSLPEFQNLADRAMAEEKKIASSVSSSDIAVVAARAKAAAAGKEGVDYNELADMHEAPGSVYSWDGGSGFKEVNMDDLDTPLEPGLHLIRHGHTAWNDPVKPDIPETPAGPVEKNPVLSANFRAGMDYMRLDMPEQESFIDKASAVRAGEKLSSADAKLLTKQGNKLLNDVAEQPDSLPKRAMERRVDSIVGRTTSSLEEMGRPFEVSGAKLDIDKGRWKVSTPGEERYFDSREEAISYLENEHSQPLNTPELADFSMLPDSVARFARDVPPPNNIRAPLTSNPPPPGKAPRLGGLALMGKMFRNFPNWIADVSEQAQRPELFTKFRALDDATIELNNFIRPYSKVLKETLYKVPRKMQSSLFKLAQAMPEDRPRTAVELGLGRKELDAFDRFNEKFVKPLETELGAKFETLIQEIMPRRIREGVDSNRPKMPFLGQDEPFGAFKEAMDVGEIDPHDQDLMRTAVNYLQVGARKKFLGGLLNDASKMVDELDEDGNYKLGLFRTPLARHIEYLRGRPDHTAKVLNSIASHVIDLLNQGKEKANKFLPEGHQLEPIETPPREAWGKMIKFMYAGELAARPALLIRDMMQFFLTTAPILGWDGVWKGVERSFGEGAFARGAADRNVWLEPQRMGALIEKKDLQSLISGEGEGGEGWLERQADKMMSAISFAHNSNRVVAYWGSKAKASEAIERLLNKEIDAKGFANKSGIWFLKKPVREMYQKEVQKLDSRLPDFNDSVDAVAGRIAKDMVESTQWNLRRGANPGLYEYQLGRLLGQYGTWPLNYLEYARRYAESAIDPETRVEAIKAMMRFSLSHGAVQLAGNTAGVDLSNWLWMNPAGFEGGPALTMLQSLPSALSTSDKGSEARKELRREFLFPGFVPGGEAMETVWKAAVEDDPHFWTRAMGFTPLEGRTELRK